MESEENCEIGLSPEDLQRKLYFLNEQLQVMAKDLPLKYQQRLPNELLCGLAESLLDNTVFGIVDNLMDIQHVTEKQLFQQRLQFLNKHTLAMQELAMDTRMDDVTKTNHRTRLQATHRKELQLFDMKLVNELDKKVCDQQRILEMAGVPGFEVTNDPIKIQVQIRLLDFILRLSQMQVPP
ncbi:gonadal protein gdl-like [Homalodisca vitripennis]|uniref:Gonadal protein gdl n=1 Tax=Homalodisca liturata TaxID=320908 RepID=A0A1B6HUE9_9HEMI|nr:gonadal protein gdl-like [Homalodisca vitripennis]